MPEKLYTTGEVAKIFGVSYATVSGLTRGRSSTLKRPAVNTARLRGFSAKHQKADAGASVHPEGPPMKRGGEMKVNARPEQPSAISKH